MSPFLILRIKNATDRGMANLRRSAVALLGLCVGFSAFARSPHPIPLFDSPTLSRDRSIGSGISELRRLMPLTGIQTIADPASYSCSDFFNDQRLFLELDRDSGHPAYLDKHIVSDPNRPAIAYSHAFDQFQETLSEYTSLLVFIDSMEKPFEVGGDSRVQFRLMKLLGAPVSSVTGTQLHELIGRQLPLDISVAQKRAVVELIGIIFTDKEPSAWGTTNGDEKAFSLLLNSSFVNEEPNSVVLNELKTLSENNDLLYNIFNAESTARECIAEVYPSFANFGAQCGEDARAMSYLLRGQFQKMSRTLSDRDFDVQALGCQAITQRLITKHYQGVLSAKQGVDLYQRLKVILHNGSGDLAETWTAKDIQEVNTCLIKMPAPYLNKMPIVNLFRYKSANLTNGWYSSTIHMMSIMNPDCHTMIHELAHNWDFKNLSPNPAFRADWMGLGRFVEIPLLTLLPRAVPDSWLYTNSMEFVSAYARLNPKEDFAESVYTSLLDLPNAQTKIPAKLKFLQDRVFN